MIMANSLPMDAGSELLKSEFKKRKERNANFSMRAFARWLNISPAQLSQMMSGKRPTTQQSLKKISSRLSLSPTQKKRLFASVIGDQTSMEATSLKQLDEDKFQLIADWYHLAILSLTRIKNSKSDPRWIAQKLNIPTDTANEALQRLVRLNLLETKPEFKQVGNPFQVSSEVGSLAIQKYHKQNLNLAAEKIETVPVSEREFQSVSMAMSSKKVKAFKKLIDDFLAEAQELGAEQEPNDIYQLNVQLFPITKIKEPM